MGELEDQEPCGDCGISPDPGRPVAWSPAYALWLCGSCRSRRIDAELNATERVNAAARLAAKKK